MGGMRFLTGKDDQWQLPQNKLQNEGLDSDSALNETIKKLENDVKKARKKEAGDGDDQPVCLSSLMEWCLISSRRLQVEEPIFNLVDVPDADVRYISFLKGLWS